MMIKLVQGTTVEKTDDEAESRRQPHSPPKTLKNDFMPGDREESDDGDKVEKSKGAQSKTFPKGAVLNQDKLENETKALTRRRVGGVEPERRRLFDAVETLDKDFITGIDVAKAQYEEDHKAALAAFREIEFVQKRGASGWSEVCETPSRRAAPLDSTCRPHGKQSMPSYYWNTGTVWRRPLASITRTLR